MQHQVIDARSLAFHRRIAAKLRRDPALVDVAKGNLKRRLAQDAGTATLALKEWQRLLRKPLKEIIAQLTAETDEGQRLRQSTPFSGILSPQERNRISQKYETPRA